MQNIETMLSLMAMAGGISEHMLTSWSSLVGAILDSLVVVSRPI